MPTSVFYKINGPEDLVTQAGRKIREHLGFQARDISIALRENELHLKGSVDSWYSKQMAQEAALAIANGASVRNELAVC